METLLKPKNIKIADLDGKTREFILTRLTAIKGREIVTQYIPSLIPKIGDYLKNKELMMDLMSHVYISIGGIRTSLSNEALIDNHVGDWETLVKLEKKMFEYNTSFLSGGENSITSLLSRLASAWLRAIKATD